MTELSVVIPTYQRRQLVCEAIDSVLAQETERTLEIIVVDDGSTDGTAEALARYGGQIRLLRQANRGISAARNAGMAAARGKFVALLDSDDAWLPFKTELQLPLMERIADVGFSFSNFFAWRDERRLPDGLGQWLSDGRSVADAATRTYAATELGLAKEYAGVEVSQCDIFHLSLFHPVVLPSTVVLRREVLRAMGPLPEDKRVYADWGYFAEASRRFGALYLATETTLNRGHDDPVRLMRLDPAERALQRLDTVRRTWKSDPAFRTQFASDLASVEARELGTLVKLACVRGDLRAADEYLEELESLTGRAQFKLALMRRLMHVSAARRAVNWLRSRRSHG